MAFSKNEKPKLFKKEIYKKESFQSTSFRTLKTLIEIKKKSFAMKPMNFYSIEKYKKRDFS